MIFYLSMFFINMIMGLVLEKTNFVTRKNRTKVYLILTFFQLVLIAGFRASTVGWDTKNYLRHFEMVSNNRGLFHSIKTLYWLEPGYIFLCYVVNIMGGNAQLSLIAAAMLIYGMILLFINRYALSPIMSVMAIFCFPVFYDSLSMVRNAIVCAFFLLAVKYIEKKQPIKYLICTMVACMFHTMAVIFIPLYFIQYINWKNWLNTIVVVLAVFVTYIWLLPIIQFIFLLLGRENYVGYVSGQSYWFGQEAGGWKTAIFYTTFFLLGYFIYIRRKRKKKEYQDCLVGYAMILPAAAFLYTIAPMFIRIMLMSMPVAGVFVSNEIKNLKNKNNQMILSLGYFMLLLFFQVFTLYINSENYIPYIPFWKG